MLDLDSILIVVSKRNKTLDFLSMFAAGQDSSINQIIASFYISSVFGDKAELDLSPLSIWPLRSDRKRDKSHAISVQRLDEEIESIGRLCLKVMNCDCNVGYFSK